MWRLAELVPKVCVVGKEPGFVCGEQRDGNMDGVGRTQVGDGWSGEVTS